LTPFTGSTIVAPLNLQFGFGLPKLPGFPVRATSSATGWSARLPLTSFARLDPGLLGSDTQKRARCGTSFIAAGLDAVLPGLFAARWPRWRKGARKIWPNKLLPRSARAFCRPVKRKRCQMFFPSYRPLLSTLAQLLRLLRVSIQLDPH
jgi:hypothetical protein